MSAVPTATGGGALAGLAAVVAGGGHNGMVAAILAATAGARVTLLEAADHLGGATTGARLFRGQPARLSRYSYLVSLFPAELIGRLGIQLPLARRAVSSYTPVAGGPGLLVEREPASGSDSATARSFHELTGSEAEFDAWRRLYGELAAVARAVAPALTGPLRRHGQIRDAVVAAAGEQIWHDLTQAPIGEMITRRFTDDTVRGVVATDALIGTHTSLFDESLLANRCFLYHVIGRGTGDWLVPVGGMGALTDVLTRRCAEVGVTVRTGVEIAAVRETGTIRAGDSGVTLADGSGREWEADVLLAAVAPAVLESWLDRPQRPPEGAQLKVNMLLRRLPRLKSGLDPAMAFAGTMHLAEGFDALEEAYRESVRGRIPDPLPGEVYCHSLADDTIMNGSVGATLTLFGLHTPARLFDHDPSARQAAVDAALRSLQLHLAEPLEDCLAVDIDGRPCLDVATPLDLQRDLRMPGGHIFHGDLQWPWLPDEASPAGTAGGWGTADASPAERFGVAVPGCRRILMAGSGSVRGGAVSGLGGLAAVDALLAQAGEPAQYC